MYEMHCWLIVSDSTEESDMAKLDGVVSELLEKVNTSFHDNPVARLAVTNGSYTVSVTALTNHFGPVNESVFDLFRWVADRAPGSYGLLYVRDDEDPNGMDNQFRVFVVRRGQMVEAPDTLLSPCVPIIEDP